MASWRGPSVKATERLATSPRCVARTAQGPQARHPRAVQVPSALRRDAVVIGALATGRALLEPDGTLERIALIVQRRDAHAREFFARESEEPGSGIAEELPAYLSALSVLMPHRHRAIDAGTGDGRLLDALAPLFDEVIALDREPTRLARAERRVAAAGYQNVRLVQADLTRPPIPNGCGRSVRPTGVRSRVLITPRYQPTRLATSLSSSLRGALVVLDYVAHDDDQMRDARRSLAGLHPRGALGVFAGCRPARCAGPRAPGSVSRWGA